MHISGIGVDIVEIGRFRALLKMNKDSFLDRHFSDNERRYCNSRSDPATHFAGTFAAKEAVQKTLAKPVQMHEIEIRRLHSGKPEVWLKKRRSNKVLVSISHEKSVACAVAFHI